MWGSEYDKIMNHWCFVVYGADRLCWEKSLRSWGNHYVQDQHSYLQCIEWLHVIRCAAAVFCLHTLLFTWFNGVYSGTWDITLQWFNTYVNYLSFFFKFFFFTKQVPDVLKTLTGPNFWAGSIISAQGLLRCIPKSNFDDGDGLTGPNFWWAP